MGKYQAYPEYQDAPADWLGSVPSSWRVARLGQYFDERREKVSDKDYAPLSVTMRGVVPQLDTAAKTDAGDNRKKVCPGDFVINSRSDRKGSSGVSELEGSVSLISIVLKPRDIESAFVHHLLRSQAFQEEFYRYGKGIVADLWSTNYSEMKNILLPIPSIDEQRGIAAFLDHETAKIDRLIARQERLIELLKEKRQAVISHAVTKGLNPDAPMKDSGVEWLGEVPAHWEASRLKYLVPGVTVGIVINPSSHYVDAGIPCLRSLNISSGYITSENLVFISEASNELLRKSKLHAGDVVVVRTGQAGIAAIVTDEFDGANCVDLLIVRKSERLLSHFLYHVIGSDRSIAQVKAHTVGAIQGHFNTSTLAELWLTCPPIEEQAEILRYLERKLAAFDHLLEKSAESIKLLQEHRTALISAAVTGKIDVRGFKSDAA